MRDIPSQIGDVLILRTRTTFTIYAVGLVSEDGQQDFETQAAACVTDMVGAIGAARSMLVAGRRIFFQDIDTGDWAEIPTTGL